MNFIKKFYDVAEAEAGAAEVKTDETPSVASLMAKQGVVNSSSNMVATPVEDKSEIKDEKPETKTPEPTAIVAKDEKVEEVKSETPKETKVEEIKPPQKEEEKIPVPSFKEQLAKAQPNEVLKELGFNEQVIDFIKDVKELDPKMVAFFNTWKTNGDVTGYLREMTTDYSKMSAEQVMRHQIRLDYPKANERQLEALYRKEVVELYDLDSEDPDIKEAGENLLEAKADRYRDSFIEKQNEKLLPKAPEAKAAEPDKEQENRQAEISKNFEAYKQTVNESQFAKDIIANRAFSFGEGEEKLNFKIEPQDVFDVLYNPANWRDAMWDVKKDEQGNVISSTPKIEHQLLVSMVAKYGTKVFDDLQTHFKSIGAKSIVIPLENAKDEKVSLTSADQVPAGSSPAAHMAKGGRINSGGSR